MPRMVWVVRWGGFEDECAGRQDAMERWGQLDACSIEAEVVQVTGVGRERPMGLTSTLQFAAMHLTGRTPLCRSRAVTWTEVPDRGREARTKAGFRPVPQAKWPG